jgi:hypothetical protein
MHFTGNTVSFLCPAEMSKPVHGKCVRSMDPSGDCGEKIFVVILYKNSPPNYYCLRNYPLLAKDDQIP